MSTLGDLALPNIKQSDQHFRLDLLLWAVGFGGEVLTRVPSLGVYGFCVMRK